MHQNGNCSASFIYHYVFNPFHLIVTLPLDHSHDNDPYAEPEDLREGMGDWKGDGNGGYRVRVLLLNGDIYNLYLNDQGYNQLVARGFRQGVNVLVKGGEGKNLIGVVQ